MRNILVVDVGGTHIKVLTARHRVPVLIPSGPRMTAAAMVDRVREATRTWRYSAVSVGYPGLVADDRPLREPHNLAAGWVGFDFERAFERPVRMINDAAMQALGAYRIGRMLYLGFGTGLGSALVVDGTVIAMELAHLPYRHGRTYEQYVGAAGLTRLGRRRWERHVGRVVALLRTALEADDLVIGGGNAPLLATLPAGARRGTARDALLGGARLWSANRRALPPARRA
jgi:polyphosphate glucokinase